MKKIIYTGAFRFPNGDAASQRVLNNAKVFRDLGYNVEFISWGGVPREEDKNVDGFYFYQGFRYLNTKEIDNEHISIIKRIDLFLRRGKYSLRLIIGMIKDIDIVIAYNSPAYFTKKVLGLCKQNNIEFISDITEWYSAEDMPGERYALPYWLNEYNMRVVQKQVHNKILISSYLNNYYIESNNIIIPPLVDSSDMKWIKPKKVLPQFFGLRIIYAGNPGKKDCLKAMLEAVLICLKDGLQIQFVVIGVSKENIKDYSCFNDVLCNGDNIILLGHVPQHDIPSYYKASDFAILAREDTRKNKAGFPTKLVESLMSGCPIIVNYTSDISDYVKDDYNGIIIPNPSTYSVRKALIKALKLDRKILEQMKVNAQETAITKFNYLIYKDSVCEFINNKRITN